MIYVYFGFGQTQIMNSHSLDDFEADFLQFLGNLPGWPEEGWSHAGAFMLLGCASPLCIGLNIMVSSPSYTCHRVYVHIYMYT